MRAHPPACAAVAVILTMVCPYTAAQSPLASAKEHYAAAEYDRCLAALESASIDPSETVAAGEYRALCLVALNRNKDASKAVETIFQTQPFYQVAPGASPKLKTLVQSVKRAVLPSIVQERYAAAKRDFDARRYADAAAGFRTVVALVDDPVLRDQENALLGDLKTLSNGFLDLIAAAPQAAAAPPSLAPAAPAPSVPRTATAKELGVTPPVTLVQALPVWYPDANLPPPRMNAHGTLELIIDEKGNVESARLLTPVSPDYDDRLIRAARQWKYKPAEQNGKPIKFRKVIEVSLRPK